MVTNTEFEKIVKLKKCIIQNKIDSGIIQKDKKGNYRYSEQIFSAYQSGKSKRAYGGGKDAEECARSFAKSYFNIIQKSDSATKPHTLAEVAIEWYDTDIEHSGINETSKKDYKRYVEKEIIPQLGNMTIDSLKERHYNDFMNRYQGQGEAKLKSLRMTLKRIIKYAHKNDYITRDDYNIKLPAYESTKKREALPENILKLLVKLYKTEDTQAEDFIILLMTGIRTKEATQLEYTDIDFEKQSIHIKKSKTENGIREIPVSDFIMDIFKKRIEEARANDYKSKFVFRQKYHPENAISVQGFEENFNNCLRKMDMLNGAKRDRNKIVETTLSGVRQKSRDGLKYPYTPYQLRHTYATLLDEFEIKQSIIKDVLGHSQTNDLTNSTYTHRSTERRHRALKPFFDIMNDFINNDKTDLKSLIEDYFNNIKN